MFEGTLVILAVIAAIQALRVRRRLESAVWLGGVSLLLGGLFYRLGAHTLAVIEVSIGAGLITILIVLAISVVGDWEAPMTPVVPRLLAGGFATASGVLLLLIVLPAVPHSECCVSTPATFAQALWQDRLLDVLLQTVMIFTGVISLLGLLTPAPARRPQPHPLTEDTPHDLDSAHTTVDRRVGAVGDRPIRPID